MDDSFPRRPIGATPSVGVFLRPLGTPLPLACIGLLVASGVLSCLNLGWIPAAEQDQVGTVLVAFAFPIQSLATVLLFLARDAPSGAGVGALSGSWLTFGLLLLTTAPTSRSATAAIFLFAAAAALVPAAISSLATKVVPAAVFAAASVRFLLTGLYEKLGGKGLEHAAGWEGIALAALALYVAFASDLEGSLGRDVLPLGRRGVGRAALDQTLLGKELEVQSEPGVRSKL
jgi:succinate-acetate transporter protein